MLPGPVEGARDHLFHAVIAAHGVHGDARPDLRAVDVAADGLDVHAGRAVRRSGGQRRSAGASGSGSAVLGLLDADADGLAAVVPAAVGARVVGLLGLVAVRTLLQLGR